MLFLSVIEILALFLIFPLWSTPEEMLQKANNRYQQAILAKTYEDQKKGFNQALSLYTRLEQEIGSQIPALDQAIADSYFQLGEYAWAILYYHRALKTDPHNSLLLSHLEKSQQKLGITLDSPSTFIQKFLGESLFTLSQQLWLLFSIILFTLLFCSLAIWVSYPWIRKLVLCCVLMIFLMLSNLLFFYYFTPLEGILVTSTGFYRAPDWNQPQLTNLPLLAGSKVRVLQTSSEGDWLKISNSTGLVGYVPTTSLRLI